jgi:predicted TIM-barrel fold metal-dependent hydrolase
LRWGAGKTEDSGDGYLWIDPHVHILPPRRMAGLVRWVKKFTPGFPLSEEITKEEILEELRAADIPFFFNLVFPLWEEETEDLNRFNRDLCADIPEAIPFGSVHIDTPDKEKETRRCIEEYGFVGMKLHPYAQRFPAFGPEMHPMFKVLNQHRRPFLVHTGFDEFYEMSMDLEMMEGIIRDYPDMQVVAVHSLFARFRLAHRLLSTYPNFWLDMTNTMTCMRIYRDLREANGTLPPSVSKLEVDTVEENKEYFFRLFEDFPHRIMYGTDFPVGFGFHPVLLEDLRYFDFGEEVESYLLHKTVRRLIESCGCDDPFRALGSEV